MLLVTRTGDLDECSDQEAQHLLQAAEEEEHAPQNHNICVADVNCPGNSQQNKAERTFFENSAKVMHGDEDQLQKSRSIEINRFSGTFTAALETLSKVERSPDENEVLFDPLFAAIKKVPPLQFVALRKPPFPTDAFVYQAKQLSLNFPETYELTDSG